MEDQVSKLTKIRIRQPSDVIIFYGNTTSQGLEKTIRKSESMGGHQRPAQVKGMILGRIPL